MNNRLSEKEKLDILLEVVNEVEEEKVNELINDKINQKNEAQEQRLKTDKNVRSYFYKIAFICACLGIINPFMILIALFVLLCGMIMTTDW